MIHVAMVSGGRVLEMAITLCEAGARVFFRKSLRRMDRISRIREWAGEKLEIGTSSATCEESGGERG